MSLPLSILFSFTLLLLYALPLQAAFLSPVRKDHTTLQYTLPILLKTPLQPTQLVLDLGGSFSWINCYNNYTSSTYHHIFCDTPLCTYTQSFACGNCYDKPFGPNCANNTCDLFPENPIIRDRGLDSVGLDDALTDTLALPTTDGKAQGPLGLVHDFIFSCAKASLLKKLANGATGMAGLGRSNISLQAQIYDKRSQ
ncbi:basic 7S globulin-like [Tripterygium wilfordii]|uniref:Basic 7S globulin-like n=1 Tax=Tripterygium wilfordii TaxID=458696 RepID=A0A7J7CF01_TRIWF|nr:basic 7S globulin-like [Tripterygium wilfordii]